jgi:hypothetical protein
MNNTPARFDSATMAKPPRFRHRRIVFLGVLSVLTPKPSLSRTKPMKLAIAPITGLLRIKTISSAILKSEAHVLERE